MPETTRFPPSVLGAGSLLVSRTFDAPRSLVWKAWTEAERLAGGGGRRAQADRRRLDFRPGGIFLYGDGHAAGPDLVGPLRSIADRGSRTAGVHHGLLRRQWWRHPGNCRSVRTGRWKSSTS